MRVITDIDSKTYEQIKKIISSNDYDNVDQFINVAIQNQLSLEAEGIVQSCASTQESTKNMWSSDVPASLPISDPYDMDRSRILLFNQYYRFFPLIISMVELGRVTGGQNGPLELSEFREHMQEKIIPIRNQIRSWEEENDIKKQNRKSTGLPRSDVKNPEYSMKRFLDHFVGKVRKRDSHPISFGNSLGLISYTPIENEKCLVQLTPEGRDLVQIGNPLLSNGPTEPTISDQEAEFIIRHIRDTLPEEFQFMKIIFEVLERGEGETYTTYIGQFEDFLINSPGSKFEDPSEEQVRSAVAGCLSRMVELRILSRGDRRGIYVPELHPEEAV